MTQRREMDPEQFARLRDHVLSQPTSVERRLELLRLETLCWQGYGHPYGSTFIDALDFNELWQECLI